MVPVMAIPKTIDTIMPEVVSGTSRFMQTLAPIVGKHNNPAAHVAVVIVVGVQVLLFPVVEHAEVVMNFVVEQTRPVEELPVVDELDELVVEDALLLDVEEAVVAEVAEVEVAVGEVDESFVVEAAVLEGAVVLAAFEVALDFAVVLSVVAAVVESLLSVEVALFLRSCFESGILHSCINHTASSFLQPLETKHGAISSNRKTSTFSIHLGMASLSPQAVRLIKSAISWFAHPVLMADRGDAAASRLNRMGRMLEKDKEQRLGLISSTSIIAVQTDCETGRKC
jgi:hypothetical protein